MARAVIFKYSWRRSEVGSSPFEGGSSSKQSSERKPQRAAAAWGHRRAPSLLCSHLTWQIFRARVAQDRQTDGKHVTKGREERARARAASEADQHLDPAEASPAHRSPRGTARYPYPRRVLLLICHFNQGVPCPALQGPPPPPL